MTGLMTELMTFINGPYFIFVQALILGIAGSFMYRWRGMNENDVPAMFKSRFVRRILCTVLIALGFFAATGSFWAFLAIPLSYYGIIVGHGSYFNRSDWPADQQLNEDNENFYFITRLIADPMNEKARWVGMALTGLATTLLVMLIPVITHFYAAEGMVVIASWYVLVGFLKPMIYSVQKFKDIDGMVERVWGFFLIAPSALVGFDLGLWHLVF